MPLLRHIRSLFTRQPPRRAIVNGVGELTEYSRGSWGGIARIGTTGEEMGVLFKTSGDPPGEREAVFWDQLALSWPARWQAVLGPLRRDLPFESTEAAAAFFAEIRPLGFVFHELSPGQEHWEIGVGPDYCDHQLMIIMRGTQYETFNQLG